MDADEFLIGQWVDVSQLQRNIDGSIQLLLADTRDGTKRVLNASTVFLLTGPGEEQSKVPDAASQQLYKESAKKLEESIRNARERIAWYREALEKLNAMPSTRGIEVQRQWMHEQIAQTRLEIPHLLTLTAIEKLYEFVEVDLDGEQAAVRIILGELFEPLARGYVGNGDTMRTLKELFEGRGPESAYPVGLKPTKSGRSGIYNEGTSSPQEYDAANRRRYKGTYTATTTGIPFKASRYRLKTDKRGKTRVEVTHRDGLGKLRRRVYDYVFDCTGLNRRPIEELVPAWFKVSDIRDLEGNAVARGDAEAGLFIVGSATGDQITDFPTEIRRIIQVLGIPENTIALWGNGAFAERAAWSYAGTHPPTKGEMRSSR